MIMEMPYYQARGEYYKEAAAKSRVATQEKLDIQAATQRATKPGEAMSMPAPGGSGMNVNLGSGPSTVNHLDFISELEKTNPIAADHQKELYFAGQERNMKFQQLQGDYTRNKFSTGMRLLEAGAIDQGLPLIREMMPNISNIEKVGKDSLLFTGTDGATQTIPIRKYNEALMSATDLIKEQNKFDLESMRIQKEAHLKADELKKDVVPLPNGLQVSRQALLAEYNAEIAPVIKYFSDPKNIAVNELDPEFGKYMGDKLKEIKKWDGFEGWAKARHPGTESGISGAGPANAIPGEQVPGKVKGRPGSMVAKTPGGTSPVRQAEPAAETYLKAHPETANDFKARFGYLPEGK